MIQETELVQLVVAVVMAPIIIFALKNSKMPSAPYIATGLAAIALSAVFTVLEGFWAPELLNLLEHAMLAVAGISFAMSAWTGRRYWHSRGSG